jgi:predicted CxxxxCH...CXXCH cytochrome family protein
MKLFIQILLAGAVIILYSACSELNNNIETAPKISVHGKGILDTTSTEFHGQLIKSMNWDMKSCWECHASDYSGGITGASCLKCHTEAEGPEACNTCHGDPNDPDKIAPPKDLSGSTSPTSRGVGAHESHEYNNQLTENLRCSNCHKFPSGFNDPAHIDGDGRAEIIFGRIAITGEGIHSVYDQGSGSCSSTYCHGNFVFRKSSAPVNNQFAYADSVMTGNNVTVNWTSVGQSQAACGSCHGLPPAGHIPETVEFCGFCHLGIVDTDGNIVDSLKYKHINGVVDVVDF